MTYSIGTHIADARRKEEWWTVENLERIQVMVEERHPFANDMQTLHTLALLTSFQRMKRDTFEKYSVDYGTEWSKLNTLENVQNCVQRAIHLGG